MIPSPGIFDGSAVGKIVMSVEDLAGESAFRVLIVEDNEHISEILEFAVNRMFRKREDATRGLIVEHTDSSLQALAMMHEHQYDLIIADLNLPFMNGTELQAHKRSAAFILTSAGGLGAEREAEEAGVSYFLAKPFRAVDVERIIKKSCAL